MGDRFIMGLLIQTHILSLPCIPPPSALQKLLLMAGVSDLERRLAGKHDLAAAGAKNDQHCGKGGRWPPPSPRSLSLSLSVLFVMRGTKHLACQRSWVDVEWWGVWHPLVIIVRAVKYWVSRVRYMLSALKISPPAVIDPKSMKAGTRSVPIYCQSLVQYSPAWW